VTSGFAEASVRLRVPHHQRGVGPDRVVAEGHASGRFGHIEAEVSLEPLPIGGHQADERDRRLKNLRC
jgi:hypothetical protein